MTKKVYDGYKEEMALDIQECLQSMQCQPILFVGSGFSRRYLGAPDWHGLLEVIAKECPLLDKEYAYYKQRTPEPPEIATTFASKFQEWAWSAGRERFPSEMFDRNATVDTYLKHVVAQYLKSITPVDIDVADSQLNQELVKIRNISPHAVITTNYDSFLETVFSDYVPVVGEAVIRGGGVSIGEILKIHGCVSVPDSIVLTQRDYEAFQSKNKYLSAKLLTYFAEHPLLFIGYSASDPNIRAILSDLDLILSPDGQVMPNVYIMTWDLDAVSTTGLPREELIPVGEGRRVRVKNIVASEFSWVFDAFAQRSPLKGVNVKVLRALSARVVKLIRSDMTSPMVQINYSTLEGVVQQDDRLPLVLGVGSIADPSAVNFNYPHSLTNVGALLGEKTWHVAHKLLEKIQGDHGIDIRATDNPYHITLKGGTRSVFHKYSDKLVSLLEKVRQGEEYELEGKSWDVPVAKTRGE